MNQNEMMIKIGTWIRPRFPRYEIILVLIIVIGFVLKLMNINESQILLTFSLSLIGILYFFYSFAPFEEENFTAIDVFIKYLSFWSLSIVSIGILFTLQRLKGNDQMLAVGTFMQIIIAIVSIVKSRNENELRNFYKSNAFRAIIYVIICLFLLLTPKEKLKPLVFNFDRQTEQTK